jgi:hypothetical protein
MTNKPKPRRKGSRTDSAAPACDLSIGCLVNLSSEKERRRSARIGVLKVTNDVGPIYAMPHALENDTEYRVGRSGRLDWAWTHRELVEKLDPIDPRYRHLIEFLFTQLQLQSLSAEFATQVASVELGIHAKRGLGGKKSGQASAKPVRRQVEQLVRACFRRGEDPRASTAKWAGEFNYSTRQIRNIISKIRAE